MKAGVISAETAGVYRIFEGFSGNTVRVNFLPGKINHFSMAELSEEMTASFNAVKVFPFATASSDGEPNVAPMGAVFLMDPGTIWIGDQFMKTTIRNIRENPRASLYVWGPGVKGCFKIKGGVKVLTFGPDYEKMKAMVKEKKPDLHCRSLLVLKVTDVYDCLPGPEAGKKII